ncbi:aminotransferase class V-fold PLP-dependent enzyme [bacterium]|nr:aminotransferase class V-fold PLP-dependent enzyme [bacterium]
MRELFYLDNGATTWPKPDSVHRAMSEFYRDYGVNPGRSGYDRAIEAEETVQKCRKRLMNFFNGGNDPDRLVFAYNATDALNQVIQGVLGTSGGHAISTNLEHNSVIRPLYHMDKRSDIDVTWIPFVGGGFIDPDDIRRAIRSDTKLVIMNHGSNVIGTCQPIGEVGRICREMGVFFAVDVSQTAGVVPIDMQEMCIDAVCFTGHKSLFGPTGIGGICVAKDAVIDSTRWGGTGVRSILKYHLDEYPYRLEAGTLNTMGIAGLLAGQEFIESRGGPEGIHEYEMKLMSRLWNGIKDIDRVIIYCFDSLENHIPVLSMNVEGFEAVNTGTLLDVDYDIATRTGLHCAPLVHEQMGTAEIKGTVRFSLGPFNTEEHIDAAIEGIREIVKMSLGWTKSLKM